MTLASWRSLQHPQLGEVRRNAPRFVLSQQVRGRASPRIILEMDIRQPDRSCVADDEVEQAPWRLSTCSGQTDVK